MQTRLAPITLEQILDVPVPSDLVAAPSGRAVAWVFKQQGRRSIWIADGPGFTGRLVASFGEDDGQEVRKLQWTPDGRAIVFARGNVDGRSGTPLNPASDVAGATRSIWIAPADGTSPRQLGVGEAPDVSPRGDQVAFILENQVWVAPTGGAAPARPLFAARGQVSGLAWSPDGGSLAFSNTRGAHTLVAVFHGDRRSIEYVSPSVDRDLYPTWSPDGRQLAFIRLENVESTLKSSGRWGPLDSPWSVMVARRDGPDRPFGTATPVWRAPARLLGSFPRNVQFLQWVDGNRLAFVSEHEDFARLYLADPESPGATPPPLTPGGCEIDQAVSGADARSVFVASNCGDPERRHLWKIAIPSSAAVSPPAPLQLTSGAGVETTPVPTADGRLLVFLKGDGRTPMLPFAMSLADLTVTPVVPGVLPATFPHERLADPKPVVFKAADGLEIHAVVVEPPAGSGAAGLRRPALIRVHGGPTAGQDQAGWQPIFQFYASRGYVVLGLNYRGGAGFGRTFREVAMQGAAGAAEYQDVVAAAEYLRARPDVDPARVGIWGASYGGYLTQLALARNSDLFAAGVTECGIFDLVANARNAATRAGDAARLGRDSSAAGSVDKWTSPVLIIHGDEDAGVDFDLQTVALVRALRAKGVPFEQLVFPDEGHGSLLWAHVLRGHHATIDFFDRMLAARGPATR
jgi:dipeptidyl aminopeptidase/acylaminoacyl peptidase